MPEEILNLMRQEPSDDTLWQTILAGGPAATISNAPTAAAKPGILGAAAETFKTGIGKLARGGKRLVTGIGEEDQGDLALFEMANGLFQATLGVPLAMLGAAVEQALPESARTREVDLPLTSDQRQRLAGGLNVLMGVAGADITSVEQMEETFKGSQPLTYGDAANLATQFLAIPLGIKALKATRTKGVPAETVPESVAVWSQSLFAGEVEQLTKALPELPPDMVRLFRGEPKPGAKEFLTVEPQASEAGRYFSSDPVDAIYYAKTQVDRHIRWIDISTIEAERLRTAGGFYRLPKSIADTAHTVPVPTIPLLEPPGGKPSIADLTARTEIPGLGPASPETSLRINLERISSRATLDPVIADVNRRVQASGRVAELGGAIPKPHAETITRAQELGLTVEKALSDDFLVGQKLEDLRPMGVAIRDLRDAAFKYAEDLADTAHAGDVTAADRLPVALALAGELEARRVVFSGEIGGALEAHKIFSESGRAEPFRFKADAMSALAQEIASGAAMDGFQLAERIQKLPTVEQRRSFMGNLVTAVKAGNKAFHAIWIQNLLTGGKTHVSNLLGTTMATLWEVPERTVAGALNATFFKDPRGIQLQEAVPVMKGLVEGVPDGIRLAGKAWREKQQPFGKTLIERRISASELDLDPNSTMGRAMDTLGAMIETYGPGRFLITEDAFLKGINARMELNALAVRSALAEGLRFGTEAFDQRVARLEARPTPRMWAEVKDAANLRTMNADPGPVGSLLMRVRDQVPGLPYVLAFMRTPINVGKWAFQRGPFTSLISPENLNALLNAADNPAARDRVLAKMVLGNTIGAYIAFQVAQGSITGSGPENITKRRNMENVGWSRNAIRVGEELYGYGRGFDPLGLIVGAVADFVEMGSQLPQDSPWWQRWGIEFPLIASQAIGRQAVNKTYMQGLSDLMDAIKQPDERARKMALGFARSLVPTMVRDIARLIDPETKHLQTVLEAMKAGVPGWSKTVAPNQNHITGEIIYYPPGWGPDILSPITLTTLKDDPVLQRIVEHEMTIAPPSDYLGGRRVAAVLLREPTPQDGIFIDGWTRKRLIDLATQDIKDGQGRILHQHLLEMIRRWDQLPAPDQPSPRMQESQFRRAHDIYYDQAERRLLDERTDLKAALDKKKAERILEKLPTGRQSEAEEAIKGLGITLGR